MLLAKLDAREKLVFYSTQVSMYNVSRMKEQNQQK